MRVIENYLPVFSQGYWSFNPAASLYLIKYQERIYGFRSYSLYLRSMLSTYTTLHGERYDSEMYLICREV